MLSKVALFAALYSADALPILLRSHSLVDDRSRGDTAGQTVHMLRRHWLKSHAQPESACHHARA